MRLGDAWGSLRGVLRENFSFPQMKDITGAAGLPIHRLAHLQQRASGGATKGQLMDAIDGLVNEFAPDDQDRFVANCIKEMIKRRAECRDELDSVLNHVGWGITDMDAHPLVLQIDLEVANLPEPIRVGLANCLRRFRNGDSSGAITAICGVVDALTEDLYQQHGLGDHHHASYQERVSRSFAQLEQQYKRPLETVGIDGEEIDRLWHNQRGAVKQAAYVLGSFRRQFSDAHGVQQAPGEFVQKALDCAVFVVRVITACT